MSTIWHYTTHEAAFSIIKNQKIHLSNLRYMNDENEFWWIYERIPEVLRDMIGVRSDFIEFIEAFKTLKKHSPISGCAICFSKTPDDPAQWDRYAQNGNGVAIGFNSNVIEKSITDNMQFEKICYDPVKQEELIRNTTSELMDRPNEGIGDNESITKFNQIAKICKKTNFSSEQEHRLLEWGIKAETYSFKARSDTLVPYVERDILEGSITEIMLGPKSLPEATFSWTQFLRHRNGGKGFEPVVSRSDCGLR